MDLDTASEENFNIRNPEETVRLIENLAFYNTTKNTNFERRRSVAILGNEHMDEVKAKLDSVHKLLKKQVCSAEDVDVVDTEDNTEGEEDVNFIVALDFRGLETRVEHELLW